MSALPVRLVATDLDGTVVRPDGTMSDRTVAALQSVEAAGATLVFVTGRPPRWMRPVAERTGHTGIAVCANGALVYDLHTERVVEHFGISLDVGRRVLAALRTAVPGISFAAEDTQEFAHERHYPVRYDVPGARAVDAGDLLLGPVFKILARSPHHDADELLALAREVVGDLVEVTHSSPHDPLLEVSAAGVSKATTLAKVCAELGVTREEVVAFGDMPNDLAMLAWAGTAYAMGNAHPDVAAAVRRRAPHVEEDGVAQVLERLFPPG